jgi:MOSC domain-containing protein YiiM
MVKERFTVRSANEQKQSAGLAHGRVASLHVHPERSGDPLITLSEFELVAGKGIREDIRYFNKKSKSTGQPTRRQVSLIEREQIQEHSHHFGIPLIQPGIVRSNIETTLISLQPLVGWEIQVGEAVVFLYEPRTPCHKMERIHPGLQQQMKNGKQGVLAQVVRSGTVRVGDEIRALRRI